jgi:hypothetical protein
MFGAMRASTSPGVEHAGGLRYPHRLVCEGFPGVFVQFGV